MKREKPLFRKALFRIITEFFSLEKKVFGLSYFTVAANNSHKILSLFWSISWIQVT